jgi:hypothetical protein
MTKKKSDKVEASVKGFSIAGQVEWDRLTENPEFLQEIRRLQVKYTPPYQGENLYEILERLSDDVFDLCKKLGAGYYIYEAVHEMVASRSAEPPALGLVHFPEIRQYEIEGKIYQEIIITPDTDLTNPDVIDYIRGWQSSQRRKPPMPLPKRENSRELDWRPLWEWSMRYPDISREEIARMLNYNPDVLRRKLRDLDKPYSPSRRNKK